MTKERRKFTPEERLSILQEAAREGRIETIRKYNLSPSLYEKWKQKYTSKGLDGLKNQYRKIDPVVSELQLENDRLKRIVAKQALEIEVKTELLKKTLFGSKIK
jgi:transposase-like protein